MIRSKIDPSTVKNMTWAAYVKEFKKDVKTAQDAGLKKCPVVMVSDFKFKCGEIHTLILLGKENILNAYFKILKSDKERKKLKDFSKGFCHFEKAPNGSTFVKLGIKGLANPAILKKNSKKLFQKLDINLKDIIKGDYTDEIVDTIEKEMGKKEKKAPVVIEKTKSKTEDTPTSKQDKKQDKKKDNKNNRKELRQVARKYSVANRLMSKKVLPLMKLAQENQKVIYTEKYLKIAENTYKAAEILIQKYTAMEAIDKNIGKNFPKVTKVKDSITQKDLARKYKVIHKRMQQEYNNQMDKLSEPLKTKFDELKQMIAAYKKSLKKP